MGFRVATYFLVSLVLLTGSLVMYATHPTAACFMAAFSWAMALLARVE